MWHMLNTQELLIANFAILYPCYTQGEFGTQRDKAIVSKVDSIWTQVPWL